MFMDVALESASLLMVAFLTWKIVQVNADPNFHGQPGLSSVILGTLLICVALVLDVSDNFPALNHLLVIGDTPTEAFLEKTAYFCGYVLLAFGFWKWLPILKEHKKLQCELSDTSQQLSQKSQSLQIQESLYQSITATIDAAIFMLDANGRVSFCTPAAERIFGYSGGEFQQLDLPALFSPAHSDPPSTVRVQELFSPDNTHNDWHRIEAVLKTSAGKEIPVEVSSSQVHFSDQWARLCIVRDISQRRNFELEKEELLKQLRHIQKMEAVGLLAGGIAHDFNNILSAIIGYSEVALSSMEDNKVARMSIEDVLKAGLRASELVKRISTFGNKQEAALSPMRLSPVMQETVALLRETLPASIKIEEQMGREEKLIRASATQIHQVLMNLCVNAGQAMPEGGTLSIAAKPVQVSTKALPRGGSFTAGQYMRLDIKDNGQGIAAEIRDKIFDPYFTTKDIGKGSGLGLAIVHGIVRDHQGWIEVDSELGRGTTFRVFLPGIEEERSNSKGSGPSAQRTDHQTNAEPPQAGQAPASQRGGPEIAA